MKIGIMCHSTCGGSVKIAADLSTELARRGHRVHLFTRTNPFGNWGQGEGVVLHRALPDSTHELNPGVLYSEWPSHEIKAFLSLVIDVTVKEELDLLHFHYGVPFGFIASEVKELLGASAPLLVGTLHGTDVSVFGRNPAKGPHLSKAIKRMDILTTVSRSHAGLAAEVFGLPAPPLVIPNFVDLSNFRPGPQANRYLRDRDAAVASGEPRIIHISNFRPVKDTRSMARIFIRIRRKMKAQLWLVGNGPDLDAIKPMFRREGIEEDVRFWRFQPNVAPLLAQADLILMSSRSESFCLAALEAMACGVPVLATDVGGLPEVVVNNETGLLFPPGDDLGAAELAVSLLSDPAKLREMGDRAVINATRYSHHRIVTLYEELYQSLLGKSPAVDTPEEIFAAV